MSSAPQLRRADRSMSADQAREVLRQGFCGRLATVSEDGGPYCVPLFLRVDGQAPIRPQHRRSRSSAGEY
jgi:uncharacterized protein